MKVTLWGGAARRAVMQCGTGRILAVFSRSFYLANAAGDLACIGPAGLGIGPLNMLCALPAEFDWQVRGLAPGAGACRDGDRLIVDGRFVFSLAGMAEWQPPRPPDPWDGAILAAGLATLSRAAERANGTEGFAPLLAVLALGRLGEAPALMTQSPLLRLARPGIAAFETWLGAALEAPDSGTPDEAAEILIGLGPGLTPSGDDFIGGAMIALHALGHGIVAARLAGWAMPLALERTGAISAAHLACAASGEGSGALHDLLVALLTPGASGLAQALAMLAGIGHSSGWDMMAGAACVCSAALRGVSARPIA